MAKILTVSRSHIAAAAIAAFVGAAGIFFLLRRDPPPKTETKASPQTPAPKTGRPDGKLDKPEQIAQASSSKPAGKSDKKAKPPEKRRHVQSDTPSAIFERLFDKLGIETEKRRKIWGLLKQKDEAGVATREGIEKKKFSSMEEAQDFYDFKCAEADVAIKVLLTSEEFARFRETEEKIPVWKMENAYGDYLLAAGVTLPLPTREAVVEMIYTSYKNNNVNLIYDPDTSWVRGATFRSYLERRRAADAEVLVAAKATLSEEEINALKKYQEAQIVGLAFRWNQKQAKAINK